MTSNKPYLIRAIYEWILDNGYSPYIVVDAENGQAQIPTEYVEDNRIVLNISPNAIRDLDLGNDAISFNARFSGNPFAVYFPVSAVLAVYASENGQGMLFPKEEDLELNEDMKVEDNHKGKVADGKAKKPHLKVIK